jgi:mismatch-specific thymine-DNA glycosylase
MSNYQTEIIVQDKQVKTLMDILPETGKLEILFIAKTPALKSVNAGHYFQGKHGKMFWNKLSQYNILNIPLNKYEDNFLLENNFGITDIVKVPRDFGNEPSNEEYKEGLDRILSIIKHYDPKVIVFVYKKVLDNILKFGFNLRTKSNYGFNPQLHEYFNSQVFVFPMPGTPCTIEQADFSMKQLKEQLNEK